jgi:hypothetical protein
MRNITNIVISALFSLCFSCGNSVSEIDIIEKDVLQEKYREATKNCEKILFSDTTQHSNNTRIIAADYLRLCLLKTGDLNNKYYRYKAKIKEMFYPIPLNPTIARSKFQYECGIPLASYEINTLLVEGHQNSPVFWDIFEKNSIITGRDRYYNSVKNYINPKLSDKSNDLQKIIREWKEKTQSTPSEAIVHTTGSFEDNIFRLFSTYRNNKEILEAYTSIILFYKYLEKLPQIAERYNMLGYNRLPDYVQEAVIVYLNTAEIYSYYGFEIEEKTRRRHVDFWQAINKTYKGMETPETIKQKFEGTYFYYCYIPE